MLDIDRMRRIAEDLYVQRVTSAFGPEGASALRALLEFLVQLYSRHDPGSRTASLLVAQCVHNDLDCASSAPKLVFDVSHIADEINDACCVMLQPNGSLHVYDSGAVDALALSATHIVYEFKDGAECFLISGTAFKVINPSPIHASIFARPTFSSLRLALEDYKGRVARDSSCQILDGVWYDKKRIFFKKKPEATMRRSLNQFLSHVLQDAEVRPEQNVDETHPVDIKVTWVYSSQRAIIEIKWLGDSLADNGSVATIYRDARALSGAKQLADYLDASRTWGPTVTTKGYLVVFDGRRRGVGPATTHVSEADGFYYKDRDVAYDPDYEKLRLDFARPLRMFMRPIVEGAYLES